MKKLPALALVCVLFVAGCTHVSDFLNRPGTQASLDVVKQAAFAFASAAAAESARQFASTGKVDTTRVGVVGGAAALWTAAKYLRQLQTTPAALDPRATAAQIEAAGLSPEEARRLAETVTRNPLVQDLARRGLPPDEANELTASAFDAAAEALLKGGAK